jgi:hypothetical protein
LRTRRLLHYGEKKDLKQELSAFKNGREGHVVIIVVIYEIEVRLLERIFKISRATLCISVVFQVLVGYIAFLTFHLCASRAARK